MIAVTHYNCIGSEEKSGSNTIIYHSRSSGLTLIDVIVKGSSKLFTNVTVDNSYGKVTIPQTLVKGDLVQFVFNIKPTIPVPIVAEFSSSDFNSDFLI